MSDPLKGKMIMAAIPCHDGRVDVRIAGSLLDAQAILNGRGAILGLAYLSYCSSIPNARNALARSFVQGDAWTHFVMIDSDTVFRAKDLVSAVDQSVKTGDVIAGAVPILQGAEKLYRFTPNDDGMALNEDGLFEVKRIGAAFMCVPRDAMETAELGADDYVRYASGEQYVRFFSEEYRDGKLIGEDYFFCDLLVRTGSHIFVDPKFAFHHVKQVDVTGVLAADANMLSDPNLQTDGEVQVEVEEG